ncbi:MAG TPA: hypothetical protein VN923_10490, partial [Thermoanaerobaculia bacterium]|nr:hypothetical protein [Thermoanaerobaculia bacterium]
MTVASTRAYHPGGHAGRADSLRWVLGSLCTALGALILVAPHRFSAPLFATATGLRQAWGAAALLAGVALLAVAALRPTRPFVALGHALAAVALLALAAAFALSSIWIGTFAYVVLAAGAALGALPSMELPDRRPHDLFAAVIAAVATFNGVVLIAVPSATRAAYFGPARPLLPVLGALFLVGGIALGLAQLRQKPPRPLVVTGHLLAALSFAVFGLFVSARQQAWTALGVNLLYAVSLAALPWAGPLLARMRAAPLWSRLAFALAASNSLALIVTTAVATAHQERLVLAQVARMRPLLDSGAVAALLAELRRGRDVAMLLLLLLAPAAIGAGVLLARRIARPLAALADEVTAMAVDASALQTPIARALPPAAAADVDIAEVGRLASSFALLHERLAERSAESARLAAELRARAQTLEELDRRKDEFL